MSRLLGRLNLYHEWRHQIPRQIVRLGCAAYLLLQCGHRCFFSSAEIIGGSSGGPMRALWGLIGVEKYGLVPGPACTLY